MQAFRRRGRSIAASWALFAIIAAPALAQSSAVPTPPGAAPSQESPAAPGTPPPPEPGTAAAPLPAPQPETSAAAAPAPPQAAETPFVDLFAQLAARLVGSVVNVSTQTAARAAPSAQETPQNSPGRTLDEVFREFLGEKAAPGAPATRARLARFGVHHRSIRADRHQSPCHRQRPADYGDAVGRNCPAGPGRRARSDHRPGAAQGRGEDDAAGRGWGDSSKARAGDWVLTIGNPFGLGGSVAAGIISAVARDIHSSPYDDYLQTDAAMNRGNSGGPMFNTRRRGDRDQHGHLFAVGRLDRDRVRPALRAGPADHRAAEGDRQGRARLDRRPRSADDRGSRRNGRARQAARRDDRGGRCRKPGGPGQAAAGRCHPQLRGNADRSQPPAAPHDRGDPAEQAGQADILA